MKNIFEMNLDEIDDAMDYILEKTTPKMLLEELKECGYKNIEITDIEEEVNNFNYVKEIKEKERFKSKIFLHKNRTRRLSCFEENMEVA